MDTLSDIDWDALHDTYREAVEQLVTAKLQGTSVEGEIPEPAGGKVIDLMAALEKSVNAAQARDADEEPGATVTALKTPAKKTTTKKAAAKKTSAKKTTKSAKKSTPAGETEKGKTGKEATGGQTRSRKKHTSA